MKKSKFLIIISLMVFQVGFGQNYLRRSNQKIVNDGGEVLLKGMNLGNWLVQEGYMMGINKEGYLSPTDYRAAVKNIVGTEINTENFMNKWKEEHIKKEDIDSLASKGFNSVRVPFHYASFYDTINNQLISTNFKYIDSVLKWCEAKQLYVILDMHCAPGAQNEDYHSDSDGSARLWIDFTANKLLTAKVWKWIASRYATKEWIGGYDLLNEPVINGSSNYWMLRNLYKEVTDSIRLVDTNHLIFAEGNKHGSVLTNLSPAWDSNLAYSIHNYWTEIPSSSINFQQIVAQSDNVPIWLGESGENSNTWYNDQVQDLESRDIGWCWWSIKKIASVTSPYSIPISAGYQSIVNYWKGSGSKPSTIDGYNSMMELAGSAALEYCTERPDVIDALLRPDFNSLPKPYINHQIPGKIFAADYDMGAYGVSYLDAEYQTTSQGVNWTDWNNGWVYRNDGVDISYTNDFGGAYYIGWTDSGEWLNYTISIDQPGYYSFSIRTASPNNNTKVRVEFDGINSFGDITLPNTSGWNSWQSLTVNTIYLTTGAHKIRLTSLTGGHNINYMALLPSSSTDIKSSSAIESDLNILPIPSRDVLNLEFTSAVQSNKTVEVINNNGLVINKWNIEVVRGLNTYRFSTNEFIDGLYYLRLIGEGEILNKKFMIRKK